MADYIYLLQNRLSAAQQAALQSVREVARTHGLTVFLVGGAVRDLTSGSPVRDLDVVVQGNALTLKKDLEAAGAVTTGEVAAWQALFTRFPGGVRMEIGSTLAVTYPKPGKPVAKPATILDDLRRRDFTVNAMALSLNDGSYGLLMDPLNGVADIENRQLRLVSNYGFIEEPVRMIRAVRFGARLGWTMDEKTQARYDTGKAERYIATLSNPYRGYESEEIFHEEDPLRVLRKLEEEGWTKHLFPALTVVKSNVAELEKLREVQTQLQVAGIHPDASTAHFPLLTAKLSPVEVAELKKSFICQGFVSEIESLEAEAKEFASQLAGKATALPSQAWKLIHAAKPEAVLWAAYSAKNAAVQAKLKSFQSEWPKARQRMPYVLMQEMRIVPELDSFNEVVEKVFFELMDGKLTTPEEQKAFLEPFSPPAPPPAVHLRRSRASKKDAKGTKVKKKMAALVDDDEDDLDGTLPDEEELPAIASEEDSLEEIPEEIAIPEADDLERDEELAPEPMPAPEPIELAPGEPEPSEPQAPSVRPSRKKAAPAVSKPPAEEVEPPVAANKKAAGQGQSAPPAVVTETPAVPGKKKAKAVPSTAPKIAEFAAETQPKLETPAKKAAPIRASGKVAAKGPGASLQPEVTKPSIKAATKKNASVPPAAKKTR